jgi:ubiquinone/menaquinone biosynthesis C-methylase UbiE
MDKIFKPSNRSKLDSEQRRKLIPPKLVLDLMDLKQNQALLDIGAGTGYFAIPAIPYLEPHGKIIAADISYEMLADLKAKLPENQSNFEFMLCASNKIDLKPKSIDHILMAFVFHEIENQTTYLQSLKPLLKANGQLTIVEWDKVESLMGPPLHERLAYDEILAMAHSVGYNVVKYVKLNEYQYACIFK